jgi:hypothetical protein
MYDMNNVKHLNNPHSDKNKNDIIQKNNEIELEYHHKVYHNN